VLAEYEALPVDVVLSGLPFTSLPRPVTHAILEATVKVLRPNGVFVTYQYTTVLRHLLRQYFPAIRITRLVLRNLPPAFVFAGSPDHRS
jgi:phospholipid N-methyltransferase